MHQTLLTAILIIISISNPLHRTGMLAHQMATPPLRSTLTCTKTVIVFIVFFHIQVMTHISVMCPVQTFKKKP